MKHIIYFLSILLVPSFALAQAAAEQPPMGARLVSMIPMFLIVFGIFYFLVIKPQNQKLKQHNDLISGLKKGDQVVTSSGLYGKVANIEEQRVVLEVSSNVKLKFEKDHIAKKV